MPVEPFTIMPVDTDNAKHVATVFSSVYGEDFPVAYVYQAELLQREITEMRLAAAIAFDGNGRACGYMSLFKTAPNPQLWEGGNLVVNPDYKFTNLASELMRYFFNPTIAQTLEGDGIFGEAVCFHYVTQVGAIKSGLRDCAIELDQLDGASFKDHATGSERVACVLSFMELTPPPGPVYLPEEYSSIIGQLTQQFLPRQFMQGEDKLPETGLTQWEGKHYAAARTWKAAVREIGADWPLVLADLLAKAEQLQVISLQVVLNTASPTISAASRQMRARGFFLGGLAPRWFGSDGLLMQKVIGKEPDYDGIKLYSKPAKQLLAFIRDDRDQVNRQAEII